MGSLTVLLGERLGMTTSIYVCKMANFTNLRAIGRAHHGLKHIRFHMVLIEVSRLTPKLGHMRESADHAAACARADLARIRAVR